MVDWIWITESGERVRPSDMGDRHLVNAYHHVKRRIIALTRWVEVFEAEMEKRGLKDAPSVMAKRYPARC